MASTVTNYKYTFNAEFPVAGVDNDSQGFRNNFHAIKTALTAADTEITNLQLVSANITTDNDFVGNSIKNVNLIAPSTTVTPYDAGATTVDFGRGQYHNLKLAGGDNIIDIVNMPGISSAGTDLKSGSMIVAVSTSTTNDTRIQFAATTGTVINLGPVDLGANKDFVDDLCPIENDSSYIFEIWNDSSLNPPEIYIKKLSSNIAGTWTRTTIDSQTFNGQYANFVDVVGQHSLTIGNNNFTTGTYTGTIGATVVTNGRHYGNLALIPNRIKTYITTATSATPAYNTSTYFGVASVNGIKIGATVFFTNTNRLFVVKTIDSTNKIIEVTQPFPDGIGTGVVTFTNPTFPDQPTVLTLASTPAITNSVGGVYANTTTFQIIFSSLSTSSNTFTTNTFVISNVLVNSVAAGSGTSVSSSTGAVVISNTGVLSISTSTGTIISTSTGYVVIGPDPSSNGYGTRYISSDLPSKSFGSNGDIWYKI